MKTRILHTEFWIDDQVMDLNPTAKLLFIYLFTNPHIGVTPIYKISNKIISFETGLSAQQVEDGKTKLQELGKIKCYRDFVYILNADRYNRFHLGKTTSVAYKKEFDQIPEEVKNALLSIQSDTLSERDDTLRNKKSEIINKKEEVVKEKQERSLAYLSNIPLADLEEFSRDYSCSQSQVKSKAEDLLNYCKAKGKKYSDYKALLRNAIKKDFGKRPLTVGQFNSQEAAPLLSEEERAKVRLRIEEFKHKGIKSMN